MIMKNVLMGLFGIYLMVLGVNAQADESNFHKVLSCDNGAVVIDNGVFNNSNRLVQNELSRISQVVIRNSQIVKYFNEAGVGEIRDFATTMNGQWISRSNSQKEMNTVRSFNTPAVSVQYDGSGLRVIARQLDSNETVNWYFRNCIEL